VSICFSCRYLEGDVSGPDEHGDYAEGFWCTHPRLARFNFNFRLRKTRCRYFEEIDREQEELAFWEQTAKEMAWEGEEEGRLREYLLCPECGGRLTADAAFLWARCEACGRNYMINDALVASAERRREAEQDE